MINQRFYLPEQKKSVGFYTTIRQPGSSRKVMNKNHVEGLCRYVEFNVENMQPEHYLLMAMIERACYDLKPNNDNMIKRQARVWVKGISNEPWSFLWVCEQLSLGHKIIMRIKRLADYSSLEVH